MPRDKATIKRLKVYREGGKSVRYVIYDSLSIVGFHAKGVKEFLNALPGSCRAHWWESNVLHSMGIACNLEAVQSFKAGTKKMVLAAAFCSAEHYVAEALFRESYYSLG